MEAILSYAVWTICSIIGLVTAVVLLKRTMVITPTNSRRIVTRFGKFVRVAQPGLELKDPLFSGASDPVSLRVEQNNVTEPCYTKQGNSVLIEAAVQYKVGDSDKSVQSAFFNLSDPTGQIKSHVSAALRNFLATMSLDEAQNNQPAIRAAVLNELKDTMEKYGYEITDVLIVKVQPDQKVIDANNQKLASEIEMQTATNLAAANYTKVTQAARAASEEMRLHGEGVGAQRLAIARSTKDAMDALKEVGVTAHDASKLVTLIQYMDMQRALADKGQTKVVFTNPSPAGLADIESQLERALMTAQETK